MQCATFDVPIDWSKPGGGRITLDVARLPSTDPAHRMGTVLSVPGGPGADGIPDFTSSPASFTALRQRFDVVTYNPRTTGPRRALPASCQVWGPELTEPANRSEYAAQAAVLASLTKKCLADDRTGLARQLDSASIARDMEALRIRLEEPKLNFIASSNGGQPTATYARLFPHRVRAMYFDGTVNQIDDFFTVSRVTVQVYEQMFGRFAAWCAETATCALHGENVLAVWQKLLAAVDRHPIPISSEFGAGKLAGFHLKTMGSLYMVRSFWPAFAEAVVKARDGDGSGFAYQVLGNSHIWTMPEARAMQCPDGLGVVGYPYLRRVMAEANGLSPTFGGAVEWPPLACSGWPIPVTNPPQSLPSGLPPALGAGTWTDYAMTKSVVDHIPGSTTIRYDGPGHVLYTTGIHCVGKYVDRYFIELKLPPSGTVCPAE
jgi:pimeloyl-ACP methyl ester carboxylesterase